MNSDQFRLRRIEANKPKGKFDVTAAMSAMQIPPGPKLKEHLLSQVVAGPNGCWIWIGGRSSNGYGYVSIACEQLAVHRASYEVHKGPIPEGLLVRHSCHVRACVNPAHLSVGTIQDNVDDRVRSGRGGHAGACGEWHGRAILTEDCVRRVKELYLTGDYSFQDLADGFGVQKSTIAGVVRGLTWRHSLTEAEALALAEARADRERHKWRANCEVNGVVHRLGRFGFEADAAVAWNYFIAHHGLNYPLNQITLEEWSHD